MDFLTIYSVYPPPSMVEYFLRLKHFHYICMTILAPPRQRAGTYDPILFIPTLEIMQN